MTETLLKTPDGNEFVVIEKKRYEALREAEEDLADVLTHRAFRARLAAGEEELLPAEMVDRILGGESPLRVWRERRGLTAAMTSRMMKIFHPTSALLIRANHLMPK